MAVPPAQVQEIVRHEPRLAIVEQVRHVPKIETHIMEKVVTVPQVQLAENIVEVAFAPVLVVLLNI